MIASLRGELAEINTDHVVVDVHGLGYRVFVSQSTARALPQIGQEVYLRIYTHVREDALLLYGFATAQEKEAFSLLTTVSGVGPRLALSILSFLTASSLSHAILNQEVKTLTQVPGVGKKTAERLILELKDKMKLTTNDIATSAAAPMYDSSVSDAVEALASLGYNRVDAEQMINTVLTDMGDSKPDAGTLIRQALKRISTTA